MSFSDLWESREFSQQLNCIFDSFKEKLNLISTILNNILLENSAEDASIQLVDYDTEETEYDSEEFELKYEDDLNSYIKTNTIIDNTDDESLSEYFFETEETAYKTKDENDNHTASAIKPTVRKYFKAKKHLNIFPPSDDIRRAQVSNFSPKELGNINDEYFRNYLRVRKLNASNIHHVFKVLIQMEDLTDMTAYVALLQRDVILHKSELGGEYWIEINDSANIDGVLTPYMDDVVIVPKASALPLIQAVGDIDLLLPHEDEHSSELERRRYVATVNQVTKERVFFRFRPMQKVNLTVLTTKYDIIFRPRRFPMRYQHRALELLAEDEKMRNFIFPTFSPVKLLPATDLHLINHDIGTNPEQLQAVQSILQRCTACAPYVIFGPPGTGKTTTVVESIIQLRLQQPDSRILVTSGSNSACDTIALRICKYFNSSPQLKSYIDRAHLIRIFAKSVVDKGLHLLDQALLKHSNCKSGEHFYPAVEEIRKYDIIIATLSTVGKLVTGDIGAFDYFTHIFIDEAGASTEPETLVGIMGTKSANCNLILCGDHKQLGPVLKCKRAIEFGLELSMMERLLKNPSYAIDENGNYNRSIQARLCRNYRSHPAIVGLYNKLYYNDELVANAEYATTHLASNWHILPNSKFPIIFQAVHGKIGKTEGSTSSYNQLEINVLLWYLKNLLVNGIDGRPIEQHDIGIITPYKLQYRRIQNRLSERSWNKVDVGSVERFQGCEKSIIIVSFVRSFSGLGFLRNPRRLNVLLSRAKSLLILIGNPVTLGRHKDFNFLITECKRNNTFLRKKKLPIRLLRVHKKIISMENEQNIIKSENKNFAKENTSEKPLLTPDIAEIATREEVNISIESADISVDQVDTAHSELLVCLDENVIIADYKHILTEEVVKTMAVPQDNGYAEKALEETPQSKLNYSVFLNSIPAVIRSNNFDAFSKDNALMESTKRYSIEELKQFNMCENSILNNDVNKNNFSFKTFQNKITENNKDLINISKIENSLDTGSQNVPLSYDYSRILFKDQPKTELLQKIVRPCWKCANNYVPVISTAYRSRIQYSKEDLMKFVHDFTATKESPER